MFVGETRPKGRARSALLAGSSCLDRGYGRFMQTDPLGYDDGLNWYNYLGSDPINGVDPSGTCETTVGNTTYAWHHANSTSCSTSSAPLSSGIAAYNAGTPGDVRVVDNLPSGGFSSGSLSGATSYTSSTSGGLSGGAGSAAVQTQQVTFNPNPTCPQTAANAAALDYSKLLFKRGTQISQDHIMEMHISGMAGKSQYFLNAGWRGVVNDNAPTYQYGVQTFDPVRGLHAFDAPHPGAFLSLIGIDLSYGTTPSGDPAFTNHLVTLGDCKTVLTSYPR